MVVVRKFYMPFVNGPACTIEAGCQEPAFPAAPNQCVCETVLGGINELYFIPCTETFSQTNVLNAAWWQGLKTANKIGYSGAGLGSISKLSDRKERTASCRAETTTSITWGLKYGIKCFDKTSQRSTHARVNEMLEGSSRYLVVARFCDGENEILPIGRFDLNDLNWTMPDNVDETWLVEITLAWKEKRLPVPYTVAGLSAVIPKLS